MTRGEGLGRLGGVLLVSACLAGPLRAEAAGPFDGTFVNADGERLDLVQKGAAVEGTVTVGGQAARVAGRVSGGVLEARLEVPGVGAMGFTARPAGDGLRIQLEGDDEVSLFRRQGGTRAPAEAGGAGSPATGGGRGGAPATPGGQRGPPATVGGRGGAPATAGGQRGPPATVGGRGAAAGSPGAAGSQSVPAGPAPDAAGAAPGGRVYRSEYEGWSIEIPRGWKHAARGGGLALGSDTEAGLILLIPTTTTDPAALDQGLTELLAELGSFAAPPALQAIDLPGGKGRWTEAQGVARDGTAIQVRAVGVVGAAGTVGVLGITTTEAPKLKNLRQRVDAIARSVRFFKPAVSPARQLLVGEWWSYTSASGISGTGGTEKSLAFCPDGSFFSSSESSYSGGAGTSSAWGTAGVQRGAARWTAIGDRSGGRITLTYPDGRSAEIVYAPGQGDAMRFDGRVYGRTGEHKYCR